MNSLIGVKKIAEKEREKCSKDFVNMLKITFRWTNLVALIHLSEQYEVTHVSIIILSLNTKYFRIVNHEIE